MPTPPYPLETPFNGPIAMVSPNSADALTPSTNNSQRQSPDAILTRAEEATKALEKAFEGSTAMAPPKSRPPAHKNGCGSANATVLERAIFEKLLGEHQEEIGFLVREREEMRREVERLRECNEGLEMAYCLLEGKNEALKKELGEAVVEAQSSADKAGTKRQRMAP